MFGSRASRFLGLAFILYESYYCKFSSFIGIKDIFVIKLYSRTPSLLFNSTQLWDHLFIHYMTAEPRVEVCLHQCTDPTILWNILNWNKISVNPILVWDLFPNVSVECIEIKSNSESDVLLLASILENKQFLNRINLFWKALKQLHNY